LTYGLREKKKLFPKGIKGTPEQFGFFFGKFFLINYLPMTQEHSRLKHSGWYF